MALRLKYRYMTLPALNDRDGGEAGSSHWAYSGTHTFTSSTDQAHSGTKSFKLVATAEGAFGSNNAYLADTYVSRFTVGAKYCITLYFYKTSGPLLFKIKVGGVTSDYIGVGTTSQWNAISFVFTAVTADTDIEMILNAAGTMYFDDFTYSQYTDLNVWFEKGLTAPDRFSAFPPIQYTMVDGSMETQYRAFRRRPTIICVLTTLAEQIGTLYWFIDNDRTVDYGTEYNLEISVPAEFENEFIQNCRLSKRYTLDLEEGIVRTDWPS